MYLFCIDQNKPVQKISLTVGPTIDINSFKNSSQINNFNINTFSKIKTLQKSETYLTFTLQTFAYKIHCHY